MHYSYTLLVPCIFGAGSLSFATFGIHCDFLPSLVTGWIFNPLRLSATFSSMKEQYFSMQSAEVRYCKPVWRVNQFVWMLRCWHIESCLWEEDKTCCLWNSNLWLLLTANTTNQPLLINLSAPWKFEKSVYMVITVTFLSIMWPFAS